MSVHLNGESLPQSPYPINVKPGILLTFPPSHSPLTAAPLDPSKASISGPALSSATVGVLTDFTLFIRDKISFPCPVAAEKVKVLFVDESMGEIDSVLSAYSSPSPRWSHSLSRGDGIFMISLIPKKVGKAEITIAVNSTPLPLSPVTLHVKEGGLATSKSQEDRNVAESEASD